MTRVARQVGVTLAELTAVLAILAILVVFAVPAGLDWWRRETVIVLADHFASAASLARATARNQRIWVHLGPREAVSGWSAGWALYTTAMPRMRATPTAPGMDDVLITVSPPVVPSVDFAFTSSQKGVDTLSYAPVGYSRTSNGAPLSGTLTIASGAHVRRVRINLAGRVRVCNPATDRSCGTGDDS
ncbi:hypothetical protein LMG10661_00657 [Ralstonia syzygii subsp. syzygii]|nr:hypothetical protein LMG10661_00657 [Ralstonia syzygii subsp. syzygii]